MQRVYECLKHTPQGPIYTEGPSFQNNSGWELNLPSLLFLIASFSNIFNNQLLNDLLKIVTISL